MCVKRGGGGGGGSCVRASWYVSFFSTVFTIGHDIAIQSYPHTKCHSRSPPKLSSFTGLSTPSIYAGKIGMNGDPPRDTFLDMRPWVKVSACTLFG